MSSGSPNCPVCGGASDPVGQKQGVRIVRDFHLRRCVDCGFAFVADPCLDFALIYDEVYYAGKGSDPLVDYAFEYEHPARTIRRYEWAGLHQVVEQLAPRAQTWLDYGCGNGGLVRHVQQRGRYTAAGFDTGAWAERARADGLPLLTEAELAARAGTFDVITAIEVIEHDTDPVAFLREIRRAARPGALLFLTTQNSCNAPRNFPDWGYVVPEIHTSYFNPKSMALALTKAGFKPVYPGYLAGWNDILRFKVLKNLRLREPTWWERGLPWPLLSRLLDRSYKFTEFPVGIAE
jgi:SAM-dependent methyltransferase